MHIHIFLSPSVIPSLRLKPVILAVGASLDFSYAAFKKQRPLVYNVLYDNVVRDVYV